jgi:hypothetical protein
MQRKRGLKEIILLLGLILGCSGKPLLPNPQIREDVPKLHPKTITPESYFPTPRGGVWKYEVDLSEMLREIEAASGEASDLLVTITSDDIRRVEFYLSLTGKEYDELVTGKIHVIAESKLYKERRAEGLLIGISQETIKMDIKACMHKDGKKECKNIKIEISIFYDPFAPILFNTISPKPGDINEIKVNVRTKSKFEIIGGLEEGVEEMEELQTLLCSVEVLGLEKVEVPLGLFDTIKVKRTCKPKEEEIEPEEESFIWYLAKGIGLIKGESLFQETTLDLLLFETNLIKK